MSLVASTCDEQESKYMFPHVQMVHEEHIPSLLSKAMEMYVLHAPGNCATTTITFDCGCLGQGLTPSPWLLFFG
jgi:hypothetical protein